MYVSIVLEVEGGYLSVLNGVEQNNQSWLVIKVRIITLINSIEFLRRVPLVKNTASSILGILSRASDLVPSSGLSWKLPGCCYVLDTVTIFKRFSVTRDATTVTLTSLGTLNTKVIGTLNSSIIWSPCLTFIHVDDISCLPNLSACVC